MQTQSHVHFGTFCFLKRLHAKILRCEPGTTSAIPRECVWGMKIVKNWLKPQKAWPEPTVRELLYLKGRRVDVTSHANPRPESTPPFRAVDSRQRGRAKPSAAAGSFDGLERFLILLYFLCVCDWNCQKNRKGLLVNCFTEGIVNPKGH